MDERALIQVGFRYALSLAHNEPDAEDLVQEAWLRLARRGGEMNRALLLRTVRNLFIDQYRRHQLVVFEPFDEKNSPEPDFPEVIDDLEPALATLRPEEREALFLNAVEGYTAQEIAEFTGRPRGTVLSLIHRGKRKMAEVLKGLWDEGREQSI